MRLAIAIREAHHSPMSLAAVLLPVLLAAAQVEAPPPPPETLDLLADADRMTLPVTIAGAGPYPFIVDTGAERSVISRELATKLGLPPGRIVRMTAMTGRSEVPTAIVPDLIVGSLGGRQIEAPALAARNLGAAGLLGLDTLQGRVLTIDLDAGRMTVATATLRKRTIRAEPGEIVVRARSVLGQLVVTEASYRGARVRVVLDTGSTNTVGNLAFKRRVGQRNTVPVAMTSVTGDTLVADHALIGEVKIGSIAIANLPVAFADAAPFARFGLERRPALLLGMDALRLFRRVEIDFANRTVRLALPRNAVRNVLPGSSLRLR